jgi:hypothetical protein
MICLLLILFRSVIETEPPQVFYLDAVVRLAWSYNPESYAGGSVAIGRITHTTQIKDDDPDKNGYPGPPVWGLAVRLTTPAREKP